MQVVCIGSTGSGTETGARPQGQGGGKSAHAASILAESTLTGAEHATNSPCMLTRSSSGLGVAKSGAGTAGIIFLHIKVEVKPETYKTDDKMVQ